jgi:hypothetical protein
VTDPKYLSLSRWQKDFEENGKTRVVSLGHDSLFYYQALLDSIEEESVLFVRTRRPREETARSMVYMEENGHKLNMAASDPIQRARAVAINLTPNITNLTRWNEHWWFYSPLVDSKDVVLHIEESVWRQFTEFQMGLWFVDEVEARWQLLRKGRPKLSVLTLWWSKYVKEGEGSFVGMAKTVAHVLGLDLSPSLANQKPHKIPFAGEEHRTFRDWAKEQDLSYLKLANYSKTQCRLISDVQWGARATGRLLVDGNDEFQFLNTNTEP